jgi:gamma-glutamyltranspeptidase / glutathione hydrolase
MFRHAVPLAVLLLLAPAARAASPRPSVGARGMVVAPESQAAAAGLEVLRDGGNAVDAAVTMALVLSVTYPRAGNLAGGGFILYRAPDGSHHALDFRETAPAALTPSMFLGPDGKPDPEKSRSRGLAVAVPGSVAGLSAAHAQWGSRPWASLVAPAVRLAEQGITVSPLSAAAYAEENARLAADPAARALFTKDGAPLPEGHRLVQKDLATTLRTIAELRADGFYKGRVAGAIVDAVRAAGGVMTAEDLASYKVLPREPIVGRYRDVRVVAFPPPSSGGVVLLQALAMLERFDMRAAGATSSTTLHRIAEAERRAFADRSRFLGDPAFVDVPVRKLLDRAYLDGRSRSIRDDRSTPSSEIGPGTLPKEGGNTLHLSVADARGGAVALTTTLNSWFGAAIVAPGTGLLLNNEIDDFSLAPGVANQFGLRGEAANAPAGGKRPLSSMCPTIVEEAAPGARPLLVLGSPGGGTIISAVLQTILHVVDDGMTLQEAVDAPRIHHQWMPDRLDHDTVGIPKDVLDALAAKGHTLHTRSFTWNVTAIGRDEKGRWTGAADARGEGVALGY